MSAWRTYGVCFTTVVALSLLPFDTFAAHRDRDAAGRRAQTWAQRGKRFGAGFGSGKVRGTHHFETASSNDFYAVSFEKGGTVFLSGDDDDGDTPLAFTSSTNDFATIDRASPLWALLSKRVAKDAERRKSKAARGEATSSSLAQASSSSTVDDLRVAPLLETQWSQSTSGGGNCYNYYTPNHYVCGCVATAMAQVMRYHRYPASSDSFTKTCYVNPTYDGTTKSGATNMTSIAGTYDWDNMPLKPASSTTASQREAIGKLCYNAGVSVYMQYTDSGSGAFSMNVNGALRDNFGYSSAMGYTTGKNLTEEERTDGAQAVACTTLANLDAGCPVLFGIADSSNNGHEIVADGYGYSDSNLYVHLNMGWAGSYDLWYNIPTMTAGGYSFNTISDVTFNIFPTESTDKAILSGRITDKDSGDTVSNQIVTIIRTKTPYTSKTSGFGPWQTTTYTKGTPVTSTYTNVTTNAKGIYAAFLPGSTLLETNTYKVVAHGVTNEVTLLANVPVSKTATCGIVVLSSTDYWAVQYTANLIYQDDASWGTGGTLGNSWGNDLVIDTSVPEPEPEPIVTYAYYQKVPYIGPYTYYNSSKVRTTTNLWPWVTSGTNPYYGAYNMRTVDDYSAITDTLALSKVYYESSSTAGKYWSESTNLVLTLGCIATNITTGTTNYELDTTNFVYTGLYYNPDYYLGDPELLKLEDGSGKASTPGGDADDDGFPNAEEMAWGIDPASSTNFPFAFTDLTLTNLTFIGSIQGKLDVLQSTNLTDWTSITTISLHPAVTNRVDLSGNNTSNAFYRVRWTP